MQENVTLNMMQKILKINRYVLHWWTKETESLLRWNSDITIENDSNQSMCKLNITYKIMYIKGKNLYLADKRSTCGIWNWKCSVGKQREEEIRPKLTKGAKLNHVAIQKTGLLKDSRSMEKAIGHS